jgi:pathogenesis-related protein 1
LSPFGRNLVVSCLVFVAASAALCAEWYHTSSTNHIPEPAASLAADMLTAHNQVRARAPVEIPPLRWSDLLTRYAQQWADHLLREGEFRHRPHAVYGENLFVINGPRATPSDVVGVWASEAAGYSYPANVCRGVCGHYTQLVWSETREVGCAVARDAVTEVWVCNYDPPGNWVGELPY